METSATATMEGNDLEQSTNSYERNAGIEQKNLVASIYDKMI